MLNWHNKENIISILSRRVLWYFWAFSISLQFCNQSSLLEFTDIKSIHCTWSHRWHSILFVYWRIFFSSVIMNFCKLCHLFFIFSKVPAHSRKIQYIPAYYSLFQPIPVYFSLFHSIPAHSSLFLPIPGSFCQSLARFPLPFCNFFTFSHLLALFWFVCNF